MRAQENARDALSLSTAQRDRPESARRLLAFTLLLGLLVAPVACKRVRQSVDLLRAVACADGDGDACRDTFAASARRCEDGEADACVLHGIQHENERVVPKDEAKAVALFERGCALGDADGCWYASSRYGSGRGVERDATKAFALAEKSCRGGSVNGCYELGAFHENGLGGEKDMARARGSYARACELSKRPDGLYCAAATRLEGVNAPP